MTRLVFADALCTLWLNGHAFGARRDAIRTFFGLQHEDKELLFSGSDSALTLLRGMIKPESAWLTIAGGSMAISPRSSPVASRVVREFELIGCERRIPDLPGDYWRVAEADMFGQTPSTLFHGTSTAHLGSIWSIGLRLAMASNWEMDDRGSAHGDKPVVSLAAEANVAAMHAYETAEKTGADPVVLEIVAPADLLADHDVMRMIGASEPTEKADMEASIATGLFATPSSVAPSAIIAARFPRRNASWVSIGVQSGPPIGAEQGPPWR